MPCCRSCLTETAGRTTDVSIQVRRKTQGMSGEPACPFSLPLQAKSAQFCTTTSNAPFDKGELAERMLCDVRPAIETRSGGEWRYDIKNYHRAIGARVSGVIAKALSVFLIIDPATLFDRAESNAITYLTYADSRSNCARRG